MDIPSFQMPEWTRRGFLRWTAVLFPVVSGYKADSGGLLSDTAAG